MIASTAWVSDSLDEMIAFARMNSLHSLRLRLDDAKSALKNDEADIEARKYQRPY
ncbi:hypothetical protein [uncultured Litoreibacter sp.]|uniref:hypothetical protein n=1 Tax=uncultured Litoreibacter sp. TaxID=1392394 RepID=UPI00262B79FE|nr:hypothetical protein [uncultured Litoreibacter sp.]